MYIKYLFQIVIGSDGVPEHIPVGDGHHGVQPRHYSASRYYN